MDLIRINFSRWPVLRLAMPAALILWIGTLSLSTLKRNDVWKSEINLWQDAVAKSPGKARPWDNLAICHHEKGREEEAIACFAKAVEVDATYIPAYMKMAILLNARGSYAEEVGWLKKGVAAIPDNADLHYQLGMALCRLGRANEGMDALQEAVTIKPSHFNAHVALGQLYRARRKYETALEHFKNADALGYSNPEMSKAIIQLELLTAQ